MPPRAGPKNGYSSNKATLLAQAVGVAKDQAAGALEALRDQTLDAKEAAKAIEADVKKVVSFAHKTVEDFKKKPILPVHVHVPQEQRRLLESYFPDHELVYKSDGSSSTHGVLRFTADHIRLKVQEWFRRRRDELGPMSMVDIGTRAWGQSILSPNHSCHPDLAPGDGARIGLVPVNSSSCTLPATTCISRHGPFDMALLHQVYLSPDDLGDVLTRLVSRSALFVKHDYSSVGHVDRICGEQDVLRLAYDRVRVKTGMGHFSEHDPCDWVETVGGVHCKWGWIESHHMFSVGPHHAYMVRLYRHDDPAYGKCLRYNLRPTTLQAAVGANYYGPLTMRDDLVKLPTTQLVSPPTWWLSTGGPERAGHLFVSAKGTEKRGWTGGLKTTYDVRVAIPMPYIAELRKALIGVNRNDSREYEVFLSLAKKTATKYNIPQQYEADVILVAVGVVWREMEATEIAMREAVLYKDRACGRRCTAFTARCVDGVYDLCAWITPLLKLMLVIWLFRSLTSPSSNTPMAYARAIRQSAHCVLKPLDPTASITPPTRVVEKKYQRYDTIGVPYPHCPAPGYFNHTTDHEVAALRNRLLLETPHTDIDFGICMIDAAKVISQRFPEQIVDYDDEKFSVWNVRWPEKVRAKYVEAKKEVDECLQSGRKLRRRHLRTSLIVKVEKGEPAVTPDVDKAPRGVLSSEAALNALLGPVQTQIDAQLKTLNGDIVYGPAMDVQKEVSDLAAKVGHGNILVESDQSKFDAHVNYTMHMCEHILRRRLFCQNDTMLCVERTYQAAETTFGQTPSGIRYKVNGKRASGRPNTSGGNTWALICAKYAALHRWTTDTAQHVSGLIWGLPGTGKSMLARARGYVDIDDIMQSLGWSTKSLRLALNKTGAPLLQAYRDVLETAQARGTTLIGWWPSELFREFPPDWYLPPNITLEWQNWVRRGYEGYITVEQWVCSRARELWNLVNTAAVAIRTRVAPIVYKFFTAGDDSLDLIPHHLKEQFVDGFAKAGLTSKFKFPKTLSEASFLRSIPFDLGHATTLVPMPGRLVVRLPHFINLTPARHVDIREYAWAVYEAYANYSPDRVIRAHCRWQMRSLVRARESVQVFVRKMLRMDARSMGVVPAASFTLTAQFYANRYGLTVKQVHDLLVDPSPQNPAWRIVVAIDVEPQDGTGQLYAYLYSRSVNAYSIYAWLLALCVLWACPRTAFWTFMRLIATVGTIGHLCRVRSTSEYAFAAMFDVRRACREETLTGHIAGILAKLGHTVNYEPTPDVIAAHVVSEEVLKRLVMSPYDFAMMEADVYSETFAERAERVKMHVHWSELPFTVACLRHYRNNLAALNVEDIYAHETIAKYVNLAYKQYSPALQEVMGSQPSGVTSGAESYHPVFFNWYMPVKKAQKKHVVRPATKRIKGSKMVMGVRRLSTRQGFTDRIVKPPVAYGSITRKNDYSKPVSVSREEYLGDIKSGPTANAFAAWNVCAINPGLAYSASGDFPTLPTASVNQGFNSQLYRIARLYEKHRCEQLEIEYNPVVGTQTAGLCGITYISDPTQPLPGPGGEMSFFMNHSGTTTWPVWKKMVIPMDKHIVLGDKSRQQYLRVRAGDPAGTYISTGEAKTAFDIATYDYGRFILWSSGVAASTTLAQIRVRCRFVFKDERIDSVSTIAPPPPPVGDESAWAQVASTYLGFAVSPPAPPNVVSAASSTFQHEPGGNAVASSHNAGVSFAEAIAPQAYLLNYTITRSGGAPAVWFVGYKLSGRPTGADRAPIVTSTPATSVDYLGAGGGPLYGPPASSPAGGMVVDHDVIVGTRATGAWRGPIIGTTDQFWFADAGNTTTPDMVFGRQYRTTGDLCYTAGNLIAVQSVMVGGVETIKGTVHVTIPTGNKVTVDATSHNHPVYNGSVEVVIWAVRVPAWAGINPNSKRQNADAKNREEKHAITDAKDVKSDPPQPVLRRDGSTSSVVDATLKRSVADALSAAGIPLTKWEKIDHADSKRSKSSSGR